MTQYILPLSMTNLLPEIFNASGNTIENEILQKITNEKVRSRFI